MCNSSRLIIRFVEVILINAVKALELCVNDLIWILVVWRTIEDNAAISADVKIIRRPH